MSKLVCLLCCLLFSNFLFAQVPQIKTLPNHRDSVDVLHYSIEMKITDFAGKSISGKATLKVKPDKNNIPSFALDLLSLNVDSLFIDNKKFANYAYNHQLIRIDTALAYTDTIEICVHYHGQPVSDKAWGGFYFTDEYAFNYGVGMAAKPPNFGRCWYPCIDNFTDRATYDFTFTVPSGKTAVSCGVLTEKVENPNQTTTFKWSLNQSVPTYLTSVAVSDYVHLVDSVQGIEKTIPIHIFVRKNELEDAKKSFRKIPDYLKAYEELFGPYAWDRIGFVSVPFDGGAMEHATNIALASNTINGNMDYEYLYAHELSHHWFGNLVTCETEKDMWLNEGWASYCEALLNEKLYGKESYRKYVQNNHNNVLRFAHLVDGDYLSLYGIPHEHTYGKTVYDKGADVIHSLRHQIGDDKFFPAIRKYLKEFAFKTASTKQFKEFLETETGADLSDFFNTWLYSPGFLHFSIDSFQTTQTSNGYSAQVFIKQQNIAGCTKSNNTRLEVSFVDEHNSIKTSTIKYLGENSTYVFPLSSEPKLVLLNLYGHLSDATTNQFLKIAKKGKYNFPNVFFKAEIKKLKKEGFVAVHHHWISPDDMDFVPEGISIAQNRYWEVRTNSIKPKKAVAHFFFNRRKSYPDGFLDYNFELNEQSNLVLLYRKGTSDRWEKVKTTRKGNSWVGNLVLKGLKTGYYALGVETIRNGK